MSQPFSLQYSSPVIRYMMKTDSIASGLKMYLADLILVKLGGSLSSRILASANSACERATLGTKSKGGLAGSSASVSPGIRVLVGVSEEAAPIFGMVGDSSDCATCLFC